MNIGEAFKQLRDAVDWLMHQIDYMNAPVPSILDALLSESFKLHVLDSYNDLVKYTVIKMTSRLCADSCFNFGGNEDLEDALGHLWRIFGGDVCGENVIHITKSAEADNSNLNLTSQLKALNMAAQIFEHIEDEPEITEHDLWNNVAVIGITRYPDLSIWITEAKRMTNELRSMPYDEDLNMDVSSDINRELQDIFGVYREIVPIMAEYYPKE